MPKTALKRRKASLADTGWYLFPDEVRILHGRRRQSILEWVQENRYVADGPAAGQWSNATFPLQSAITEAVASPDWSKVVVVAVPQRGKTDSAAINTMLYFLFHSFVDCMYVMPSMDKAEAQWSKKIRKAVEASDTLADQLLGREEGGRKGLRHFRCGKSLFLVGANSRGQLASVTCPVVVCDEVDEYEPDVGGAGHPADQAFKRTRSFPPAQRRNVEVSTVTTADGRIWQSWESGTQFLPLVPCPGCGTYMVLTRDANPPREEKASRLFLNETSRGNRNETVHMDCPNESCTYLIFQRDLAHMLARVRWTAKGQSVALGGEVIGEAPKTRIASYWYNAFYWPFDDWADLANEWVEAQGHPDKEKDFRIHVECLPYVEPEYADADAMTPERLAAHAVGEHHWRTVPRQADMVLATADVHGAAKGIYYVIRAWNKVTGTSWLVDAGTIGVHGPKKDERQRLSEGELSTILGHAISEALEDFWQYCSAGWEQNDTGGVRIAPSLHLVDCGYRQDEVGFFCLRRGQRWRAIKGIDPRQMGRATAPMVPIKPSRSRGLRYPIWESNVSQAKHLLRELIELPPGLDGSWNLYTDRDLTAYKRQLCAEQWLPRNHDGTGGFAWRKPQGAGPHDWWDCEAYQVVAAAMMGVRLPGHKMPERVVVTDWFARRREKRRAR